jgi:hypothetical protein
MGKSITHAGLVVLTLGLTASGPAAAQVGPDARPYMFGRPDPDRCDEPPPRWGRRPPLPDDAYDWPRRPPPPPPPPDDDGPRYRGRYRYERPLWRDSVCVTARGTCVTAPAPPNAPCGCEIPGFGYKRGQIAD